MSEQILKALDSVEAKLNAMSLKADAEIKAFYDANSAKFNGDEQRQASHILIGFGNNPTSQDKQKAKASYNLYKLYIGGSAEAVEVIRRDIHANEVEKYLETSFL